MVVMVVVLVTVAVAVAVLCNVQLWDGAALEGSRVNSN